MKFLRYSLIALAVSFILPLSALAYTDTTAYESKFSNALDYAESQKFFNEGSELRPEEIVNSGDLLRIILSANGFSPTDTELSTEFTNVSDLNAPYIQRMRELGVIYFNPFKPEFEEERAYPLWRAMSILMKIEGVPVPRVFDDATFRQAFPSLQGKAVYSAVILRAHQIGLTTSNNINPLAKIRRIDLVVALYNIKQYKERIDEVINQTTPNTGQTLTITVNPNTSTHPLLNNEKFPILLDVWDKVTTEFVDNGTVDEDELVYGAVQGLVDKLGDPFSVFQEPEISAAFQNSLSNEIQGIGASLALDDAGNVVIVTPLKGSPAESAGIEPGDIIVRVDGVSVGNMNLAEVVNLIQGQSGTSVALQIKRGARTLSFNITRARISIPSVEGEVTNDNILVMTINNFGFGTAASFGNILDQVDVSSLKGVVVDLRGNPGGFLTAATDVAGYFVEQGKTVTRIVGPAFSDLQTSQGPATLANVPTYVLINRGSASASEILAGALDSHGKATLLGVTTFGKGTVQEVTTYGDSSSLKLTIAKWLLPDGGNVNNVGINPDIVVEYTQADRDAGIDPQLSRALSDLRR